MNMVRNILINVVGSKVVAQGIVLPSETPPKMVKHHSVTKTLCFQAHYFMDYFTDASRNGEVESPNGTSQEPSSQTGIAHDEEDAIMSHASDKFPHHNPLGFDADEHGEERSHKHCFKVSKVVVLPSATPPKMVKIKNIESPHVKPLLTSLQKVSLLVLIIVDSAIKKSQLREKYTELTASLSFAKALLFTAALDH